MQYIQRKEGMNENLETCLFKKRKKERKMNCGPVIVVSVTNVTVQLIGQPLLTFTAGGQGSERP